MTWNFKARPFAPRKSEPARSPALQKSEPNLDKTYGVIHDNNNTEVREASHIDFAHKKRQLYVSLETPPPPLEASKMFIDTFLAKIRLSYIFDIWAALYRCL